MNFDRLAGHYHWLEKIFAGELMQRCRTSHLSRTSHCRRALLVGEGTGRFLVELLRANPHIRVTCVEHSAKMIRQTRRRLQRHRQNDARVEFLQTDALQWKPPREEFDLLVTNFFLDCFRAEQLRQLIPTLAASATKGALWLIADFRLPESGWRRWRARGLLISLYAFFRVTTSLPANRLTSPEPFLAAAGFIHVERCVKNVGFAYADLWTRDG